MQPERSSLSLRLMLRICHVPLLLLLVQIIFHGKAFACSCAPVPLRPGVSIEQIRDEKRQFFLNEFKGAAFIGKIVKRENVRVNWMAVYGDGSPASLEYYRYTIKVRDYWFGVDSSTVIVYGEPDRKKSRNEGTTSCGFRLEKGQTYFFTPHVYQSSLEIQQCDFAGGGSDPSEYPAAEFRKIMGEPRQF